MCSDYLRKPVSQVFRSMEWNNSHWRWRWVTGEGDRKKLRGMLGTRKGAGGEGDNSRRSMAGHNTQCMQISQ
jgi:hypothetical protein